MARYTASFLILVICGLLKILFFGIRKPFIPVLRDEKKNRLKTKQNNWRLAGSQRPFASDICSVDRITATAFTESVYRTTYQNKRPFLLIFDEGSWVDRKPWALDALLKCCASSDVSIATNGEARYPYTKKEREALPPGTPVMKQMSIGQFVFDMMNMTQIEQPQYVFDRGWLDSSPLNRTITIPSIWKAEFKKSEKFFLLGPDGSSVSFHAHESAWNGVVFGAKRWFLYPPTKSPPGGPAFGSRQAGFPLQQWLTDVFPALDAADRPLECTQPSNSIMYIPENWYHAVVNIGDTIATSYQTGQYTGKSELSGLIYQIIEAHKKGLYTVTGASPQALALKKAKTRQLHERLVELRGHSAQSLRDVAGFEMEQGNKTGALTLLKSAIAIDPFFIDAYLLAAYLIGQAGDLAGGLELLATALRKNPKHLRLLIDYAVATESSAEQKKESAAVFSQVFEAHPERRGGRLWRHYRALLAQGLIG